MNQRLQYEQFISTKLESLPIPDMQDTIWSRIEAQLDIDMPSDGNEGVNHAPSTPQGTVGPLLLGISVGVIAIATLILIFKYLNQKKEINTKPATIEQNIKKSSFPKKEILLPDKKGVVGDSINDRRPLSTQPTEEFLIQKDANLIVNPEADSIMNIKEPIIINKPIIPLIKTDSASNKKKSKGVNGIQENDYKIIPKGNN